MESNLTIPVSRVSTISGYESSGPEKFVTPITLPRNMRFYAVSETEASLMSILNGVTTGFFGAAMTFVGIGIGICSAFSNYKEADLNPFSLFLYTFGTRVSWILAGIFLVLSILSFFSRRTILNTIKSESKIRDVTV